MRSGDACPNPECSGRLCVRNSKRVGDKQIQYLNCVACGGRPAENKIVREAADIRRRVARVGPLDEFDDDDDEDEDDLPIPDE